MNAAFSESARLAHLVTHAQLWQQPTFEIHVPGLEALCVKCDPRQGFYLYNHLLRRTDTGDIYGSTEVYAHLEKSWFEQSALLQNNWKTVFGDASVVLEATEHSLTNGTPLGTTLSWEKVLLAELERQGGNEINPDTLGWRDLLLQAWRGLEAGPAEPMAKLDTVVFTNA